MLSSIGAAGVSGDSAMIVVARKGAAERNEDLCKVENRKDGREDLIVCIYPGCT